MLYLKDITIYIKMGTRLFTSKWAQGIYLLQSIIVGAKPSFLLIQIVANSYNTINSNIS